MVHIPGVRNKAADAVSRHTTGSTNPDLLTLTDDIAAIGNPISLLPLDPTLHSIMASIRCEEPPMDSWSHDIDNQLTSSTVSALSTMATTWDSVKLATTSDKDLNQLVSIIESGFPEFRHELPPALHEYYQFREDLYTVDGVILYKDRIIIPPSLRQQILTVLHSAHQGVTSMTSRAESTVFWPGITPQRYEQTAVTATAWHPHNRVLYHSHPRHQYTHSSVYVLTSQFHYKGFNLCFLHTQGVFNTP